MRFRRHAPAPEEIGIDLAPMLDFFLNLLIFFIVSAAFVSESGLKLNRPAAQTATRQPNNSVFVGISPEGEIYLNRERVDIRLLKAKLDALHAQKPDAPVVLQADRNARAGLLVEAMDQARLAGFADVAIAATPGAGTGPASASAPTPAAAEPAAR